MTNKCRFYLCLLSIFFTTTGCAHFNQQAYSDAFSELHQSAVNYQEKAQYAQVVFITRELLDAEPDNSEVQALQDKAVDAMPELSALVRKSLLGSNITDRVADDTFPWYGRILLYIPNRVFDLLDIITVEAGVCYGVGAKVKATDAASLGAQLSLGELALGLDRRHLSARATAEEYLELFPFEFSYIGEGRGCTGGSYAVSIPNAGIKYPSDRIYQRARDYWGIGAQAELGIAAVKIEFHPIELFDLAAGILFFDPLHDDIGVSKNIKIDLSNGEIAAIKELEQQVRSR